MKQNQPARSQQTTGQRSNRQQRPRTGWLQLLSAAGVSERQLMSVCRVRCRLRRASTPDHFTNSLDCRCWAGSSRDVGTGRTVSLGRAGSGWDDQNAGRLLAARLGSLGVAAGQQLTTPSRQLPAAHQPTSSCQLRHDTTEARRQGRPASRDLKTTARITDILNARMPACNLSQRQFYLDGKPTLSDAKWSIVSQQHPDAQQAPVALDSHLAGLST